MTQQKQKLLGQITNGPGDMDLMLALFDHANTRRLVNFDFIPSIKRVDSNNLTGFDAVKAPVAASINLPIWITCVAIPDITSDIFGKMWNLTGCIMSLPIPTMDTRPPIAISNYSTQSRNAPTANVLVSYNNLKECWPFVSETVCLNISTRLPDIDCAVIYELCDGIMKLEGRRVSKNLLDCTTAVFDANFTSPKAKRHIKDIAQKAIESESNCFTVLLECLSNNLAINTHPFVEWKFSMISPLSTPTE